MTIIKLFVCGHWIIDLGDYLAVGNKGHCHYCAGTMRMVIAKAETEASFIPGRPE